MTLSDALHAARMAQEHGDSVSAETAARKALELSGIQERTASRWFPKLTAEQQEAALEAAVILSRALLQQGRWREAVQAGWDLAGMDRKRLVPIKLLEAEAHFRGGDWRCGTPLHVARQLLEDRPEGALQAEVHLAAARYARVLAYYEDAAADLRKAGVMLKQLPEARALWACLEAERGWLAMDWKEDAGAARAHFLRALEFDADHFDARRGMGDVELMREQGEAALRWLGPLESGQDPEVLASIGWAHGYLGDNARGVEYFERAVQRSLAWYGRFHPVTGLALYWFGTFRQSPCEQMAEAVELLERSQVTLLSCVDDDHPWVQGVREILDELRPQRCDTYVSPNAERHEAMRQRVERLRQARVKGLQWDVQPPAAVEDVEAVERVVGRRLPESFRDVLLGFARALRVFYYEEDRGMMGCLEWNLERLLAVHSQFLHWEGSQSAEEWAPWRNRLGVLPVGNGDYVTIDLGSDDGAVLYYDHEWSGMEGAVLAPNFGEFLRRVVYLGAVGDHSYREFLGPDGLDVESDRAREWHAWIYGES
ncbi:MAG: SMI1/KNR4 family protein [Bryobacteraceae bacterium]